MYSCSSFWMPSLNSTESRAPRWSSQNLVSFVIYVSRLVVPFTPVVFEFFEFFVAEFLTFFTHIFFFGVSDAFRLPLLVRFCRRASFFVAEDVLNRDQNVVKLCQNATLCFFVPIPFRRRIDRDEDPCILRELGEQPCRADGVFFELFVEVEAVVLLEVRFEFVMIVYQRFCEAEDAFGNKS